MTIGADDPPPPPTGEDAASGDRVAIRRIAYRKPGELTRLLKQVAAMRSLCSTIYGRRPLTRGPFRNKTTCLGNVCRAWYT